jgi:hypothetical protein
VTRPGAEDEAECKSREIRQMWRFLVTADDVSWQRMYPNPKTRLPDSNI